MSKFDLRDGFHLVLPSNNKFAGMVNTPSHYKTQLPVNINFEEPGNQWEVACIEMSFVNAIKTLPTDETIEIHQMINPITKTVKVRHVFKQDVDMYTSVFKKEEDRANFHFAKIDSDSGNIIGLSHPDFTLSYQPQADRFSITRTNKSVKKVFLNAYTAFVLGFTKNRIILDEFKFFDPGRNYRGVTVVFKDNKTTVVSGQKPRVGVIKSNDTSQYILELNMTNTKSEFVFILLKEHSEGEKKNSLLHKVTLTQGYYKTTQHLIDTLNKALETKKNSGFSFAFNEHINRVICTYNKQSSGETQRRVCLSPTLAWVLGFDTETEFSVLTSKEGKYPPDLRRGIYSFYVYCDLCAEVCVGDSLVPLLRTVSYNGTSYGEHITVLYNNPIYVPLNKHYISTIEVKICDDNGQEVPFVEGKTVLTLHFRKHKACRCMTKQICMHENSRSTYLPTLCLSVFQKRTLGSVQKEKQVYKKL